MRVSFFIVGLTLSIFPRALAQTREGFPAYLASRLSFESGSAKGIPLGWHDPIGSVVLDQTVVHAGKGAARIERTATSAGEFSPLSFSIPAEMAGSALELQAFVRTENVVGAAALWLREDGVTGLVAFDNMRGRQLSGTHDWEAHSIQLPLKAEARTIIFGALLGGTGRVWVDDVQLLVDGKPVWLAPHRERPSTIQEADREFDDGSRIALTELSPLQVENLVTLGKVWGFLKYHHIAVTSGKRQWDYELFRVMPRVLSARDQPTALAVMDDWVESLGRLEPCRACATLDARDLHLQPDLDWISDRARLGNNLSVRLQDVLAHRPTAGGQFYVTLTRGVGNPSFDQEMPYEKAPLPDSGFQILAAFRFWNIVQYWAPYRNLAGVLWDRVLLEHLPRVALARTRDAYRLEVMAMVAALHDTHANVWNALDVRPPTGACQVPVAVRFVEGLPVVSGPTDQASGTATGLKEGDIVEAIDGVAIARLIEEWTPYYAASNDPTRLRDIGRALLRGPCGEVKVKILRDRGSLVVTSARSTIPASQRPPARDLDGATFRRLSDDVAYLKLSSVKAQDVAGYMDSAKGTKGLIVDIRNYPSEFVVFALGSLLVGAKTPFARFTTGDLQNPGAFHFGETVDLEPANSAYTGHLVILIDEVTQSQAEYTAMALRCAKGALVIGSTTAGADGNVSPFTLPGGLRTMISGIGVFYPDKRPTQRIGIVPDVEVRPTVAGLRDCRDEVLEEAVRRALGPAASKREVEVAIQAVRKLAN